MSDDTYDNLLHFPSNLFPLASGTSRKRGKYSYCQHAHALIDENARQLECRTCGAQLDPIAWIVKLAHEPSWLLGLRTETRQLRQEVEELKAEITRLRATRNRLKKKAPP
jgi:hypothetical protein